jgi:hypothetical protein
VSDHQTLPPDSPEDLEESFVGQTLVTVARDRDYPLDHIKAAITEGALQPDTGEGSARRHDRGIDAVIIALGDTALDRSLSSEDIARLRAAAPDDAVRVLLLSCNRKRAHKQKTMGPGDIEKFETAAKRFLTDPPDSYVGKQFTNPAIEAWYRLYDALRQATEATQRPWQPQIDVVIATNIARGEVAAAEQSLHNTITAVLAASEALRFAKARRRDKPAGIADVRVHTYGDTEIAVAKERFRQPPPIDLVGVQLLALPPSGTGAKGYIGWLPAGRLIEALADRRPKGNGLDPVYFSSNPRGDLGDEEKDNPGGLSLREALLGNERHDEIVFGHNGVVIVADAADGADEFIRDGVTPVQLIAPHVVNGRQSCRQFFEHRERLAEVSVPIRVIVTPNADTATDTRETVSLASNTQAPMKRSDLLALNRHVRALEKPLRAAKFSIEQFDFVRLRGGNVPTAASRIVRPDDFLDAFGAAYLLRPHTLYTAARVIEKEATRKLFSGTVVVDAFRALAWLVIAVDRWAVISGTDFDGKGKIARHQVVAALWILVSGRTTPLEREDLAGAVAALVQYDAAVSALALDTHILETAPPGHPLPVTNMQLAVDIVREIAERPGDPPVKKSVAAFTTAVIVAAAARHDSSRT